MRTAMPSPRNTNFANLFLPPDMAAAYDSKTGLDTDKVLGALKDKYKSPSQLLRALGLDESSLKQEPDKEDKADAKDDDMTKTLVAISDALERGDVEAAKYALSTLLSGPTTDDEEKEADKTDQPPPFAGRPSRGGAPAMDSFRASLHASTSDDALGRLRGHLDRIKVM